MFIHDGARPFITEEILKRGLHERETGACVVGMPSKDTVKLSDEDGFVSTTPERKQVWTIQTPQIFSYALIRKAHESIRKKDMSMITDDAMVVEQESGLKSALWKVLSEYKDHNTGGSGRCRGVLTKSTEKM